MTRIINCIKLGKEAEGLDKPPFNGDKGQFIFDNISKQVWQEWITRQTMIINEQRLISYEPKARKLLESEREKFLFSDDSKMPAGYVLNEQK